jgi:probable F420-dependent oxidoreductase
VVIAPLYSPTILAKRAATLACLSGDRLVLGLGIGWQKEEYAAVGVPYAQRGARLDECIEAMRELWGHRPATYHGRFVDFDAVHLLPSPPAGRIPIVLGGNTPAAVTRAARVADGWYPHALAPDEFAAAAELLRTEARRAGRDPADIEISVMPASADREREMDPAWVGRFVAHGATRLVIGSGMTRPDDVDVVRARIERYREQVLDELDLPDASALAPRG